MINEKYVSFIIYIKNTWVPRFREGMLNYAQKEKKEWTNNAIERYHQRLQQKLPKNPSTQLFFNEIQQEEKYYLERHLECLKYGNPNNKQKTSMKRKIENISKSQSNGFSSNIAITEKESLLQTKKFMMFNEGSQLKIQSTPILIQIGKENIFSNALPWIKWKNYSCRVDAFATLAFHIFYKDFADTIFPPLLGPKLPNELHPVGTLLKEMNDAPTLPLLQKTIDNYILYRSKSKGEKPGKGGPIATLFTEFKGVTQFTWKFETQFKCNQCGESFSRTFDSDPIHVISSSSLLNLSGQVSLSIRESLGDYMASCPKEGKENLMRKTILFYPNYYCCLLDYSEDLQRGYIQNQEIPSIKIEESLEVNDYQFSLAAIIYFKELHYTTHIKGIYHPKFMPIENPRWFFHDGAKVSTYSGKIITGLLFENVPNLNVDVVNDRLLPHILIYRVVQKDELFN